MRIRYSAASRVQRESVWNLRRSLRCAGRLAARAPGLLGRHPRGEVEHEARDVTRVRARVASAPAANDCPGHAQRGREPGDGPSARLHQSGELLAASRVLPARLPSLRRRSLGCVFGGWFIAHAGSVHAPRSVVKRKDLPLALRAFVKPGFAVDALHRRGKVFSSQEVNCDGEASPETRVPVVPRASLRYLRQTPGGPSRSARAHPVRPMREEDREPLGESVLRVGAETSHGA